MFFRENLFMVDIEGYHTLIFFSIGIAALVIYTHRANIGRLIAGTESRMMSLRPGVRKTLTPPGEA
jgi:glycerol-3-phosphate acyltransferase PlsY